jgi:hypothetical protein
MSDIKTVLTHDEINDIICSKRKLGASLEDICRAIEAAVLAAATPGQVEAEIVSAAKNLVKVKGRHHSENAYQRLVAAVSASVSEQKGGCMSDAMLFGVLRMPLEMAMRTELSRMQFHGRALEAADRIEKLQAENAELRAQLSAQSVSAVQPVAHQFYEDGKWHNFQNDDHYRNTVAAGYQVRALYTHLADADAVDAKRLDWLIGQDNCVVNAGVNGFWLCWLDGHDSNRDEYQDGSYPTARDAIDAAIAAQSTEGAKG